MDGPLQPRGRGFRINGASSRPVSRNKQWINGQDNSGHTSDSERWERGGGPRRGRGRGRGSGRSTPRPPEQTQHLAVPSQHDEMMSGTEDEGHDDAHSGVEDDEVELADVEEKELQTPEERERFYQELVKARELERKKAIAEGKMDDPLVPKRLDEAITMVGTCMDMCPRFERYRRERENNLDRWEVIPGTKRVDHKRAVKIYERAAGDKTLPSDLRPPPILKKTLDYLFHELIPRGGFRETYTFIRDRSRAVRSDFTMQHETGALAIECHDRCARFHILALHLERDNRNFSLALEEQQLMNTLQSLKEFYEDQRGRYQSPTELEMRVYHRLIHIRDQKERHEDIPPEILENPIFQLVTKFRLVVQAKSAPITKTSKLVVDQEALEIFGQLAAVLREQNNIVMIYLVACIMERLFGTDTIEDIESIRGDLTIPEIIDGLSRPVQVIDYDLTPSPEQPQETELPPSGQPIDQDAAGWPSSSSSPQPTFSSSPSTFGQPPPARNGDVKSVFGSSSAPQPAPHSAFGNIASSVTTSNGPASVFGGPTFGTAPKSVFGGPVFGTSTQPSTAGPPQGTQSVFSASPPAPASGLFAQPSSSTNIFSAPSFLSSTQPPEKPSPPKVPVFDQAVPPPGATTATPAKSPFGGHPSYKPAVSSPLNPNATSFTPGFLGSKPTSSEPPAQAVPSIFSTQPGPPDLSVQPISSTITPSIFPSAAQQASPEIEVTQLEPTQVPTAPSTPPPQEVFKSQSEAGPSRIIDRRQTLWDFPGKPQLHEEPPATPIPLSPSNMPQMTKPAPLTLPSTPTAHWFDPSSLPPPPSRENSGLLLRKQSLGLFGLQMPSSPVPPEVLSPLALPSPKPIAASNPFGTPTPSFAAPTAVASSSKALLDGAVEPSSPTKPPKNKGKAKDVVPNFDAVASEFLRKSSLVKKYFRLWMKKATDHAIYTEALRRSESYKEKVHRHRLSSSVSSIEDRERPSEAKKRRMSSSSTPEPVSGKRSRRRISSDYRPPVSDEELARRLKENHEEHQRRWARGTFLDAIRHRVRTATADEDYPPEWRIWLSTNTVNDGTAIWLETKFDVPESGEWHAEGLFSIPVLPKIDNPPSPGAPGLIVFERTAMDGVEDVLERKYRILDDCARLRDIIEAYKKAQPRFKPALAVITWAETDGPEAAPDFGDMVKELRTSGVIRDVQSLVIASSDTDLDKKFEDLLCRLNIDVEDKLTAILSWRALTDLFTTPVRTLATDWLDSCWTNDRLDWTRYGEVIRSLEDVQNALLRELLSLLDGPRDVKVDIPVDFDDSAHLSAAYASGPFLDACLRLPVIRAEEVLGEDLAAVYAIPRAELEESRRRLESVLQVTADHLRHLAAATMAQKRPASDESLTGSPGSTNKRFKLSFSPASTEQELEPDTSGLDGFLTPPPPSTSASTAALSDVGAKPQVTIAMLRALAQGVLKSK